MEDVTPIFYKRTNVQRNVENIGLTVSYKHADMQNITLHELNIIGRNDEKIRRTAPHEHTDILTLILYECTYREMLRKQD